MDILKNTDLLNNQKTSWEENIIEWTGMDFASLTRAAENITKWREINSKSSVLSLRSCKIMGYNRQKWNYISYL